ncbi:MAG: phosphatidate cytidylyltransferase [Chitinophagales bacterium]
MNPNLRTRLGTALVFGTITIACIYLHPISLITLFATINIGCLWEFQTISDGVTGNSARFPAFEKYIVGLIGTLMFFLLVGISVEIISSEYLILIFPLTFLVFIKELFSRSRSPFSKVAANLTSILWITIPLAMAIALVFIEGWFNPNRLMSVLLLVWTNDSFAYLVGSQIGKHKLFERISPKKTWEGFAGGLLGSLLMAGILAYYSDMYSLQNWLIIALLCSIFGTFGDLVESALKRSVNIKDSGNILPGHGGFLDRFDALIFCLPFVYSFVYLLKN